jgi:hypothetical protein
MSFFNSCTQDNPTALQQDQTYSFSGYVLDGYTGKALGGAVVTYFNEKGDSVTNVTGSDGGFLINKIPYGDKSFFFSYRSAGADTTKYTTAAITIEGGAWDNFVNDTIFGKIKNVAGPVMLYPLSGSLTGNVLSQTHARSELNPVGNTVVKVTFEPARDNQDTATAAVIGSNIEIGPRTFETTTDASGRFVLTGLPVSGNANEKVTIKVVSVTSNGIDWVMADDGIKVELAKGQSVPVGQIIMNPMVKIALKALDNNFKTGIVAPEHSFEITYSDNLDTVASYAVLADSSRNITIATSGSGKKITINPAYSLVNGKTYKLTLFAYGLKGQSVVDTFSVTVAGGGLADVVSSNILTDTKSPVFNLGVKTPVTFVFTDSIVGEPAVDVSNCDVSFGKSNKTLTITPKGIWKEGGVISVNVVLSSGKTVSFSTAINTEKALAFVTSNVGDFNLAPLSGGKIVPKNGLGLTDPIVFTTNKEIISAAIKVILKDSNGVSLPTVFPVTVAEGNQQISIQPVNTLKPAAKYTVMITVENASGESKTAEVEFITTAAKFFPISDNVRIGNDANMPRLDFAPNANIVIKMNKKVAKATASLTGSALVNVKVTILDSSIVIDPEEILTLGQTYNLDITAEDSTGATISGNYVTGLVPQALVIILASNIITADNQPIVNAGRAITPWFKLSSAPVVAEMKVTLNTGIDVVVTVSGDTLFVNPVADFVYAQTCIVTVTGVAVDGNYISFSKSLTVEKKPVITIVKSNVLNDNFEGLTNVAENIEMWYKLSRTLVASSIAAKVDNVDAVVRTNADTVFVKSVKVFGAGAEPVVEITGLDNDGIAVHLIGDGTDWPAFKVRPALFPVASNTWGTRGMDDPAKDFPFYGVMWVKFSQALSTDLNDITWSTVAGAYTVRAKKTGAIDPNATAWIHVDTLFVLPDNRAAITYDMTVGFGVTVKTTLGQVSPSAFDFTVKTTPLYLNVKVTNTLDANGVMREDFGAFDEVWVVSSVSIDTILDAYSAATPVVGGAVPDAGSGALRSRIRLSTNGDTIFYTPATKLISGSTYSLDFDVRLKGESMGTVHPKALDIAWKVKSGVAITAMNVMANGSTFRPFKVIGDSLVVTFSKAIDTSASAPTTFTINGIPGIATTKVWSNNLKTVTIKNTDTLSGRPYSIAANDYTTTNPAYDYQISFDVTCTDGEEKNGLIGENAYVGKLAIKTEQKLALIGTNAVPSHVTNEAIAINEAHTDEFAVAGNPTLVFSRAIDTNKVKADVVNLYQNFIQLRKSGSSLPLEFAISFSSDAKTVTINPVAVLDYATEYNIVITGIPVVGMMNANAFTGNGGSSSILTLYDFKTVNAPAISLAGKATTILIDSQSTTLRYGYTPANANYNAGAVAAGSFRVKIQKTAWNANYLDSVSGYQFRIRNSVDGTVWSGWTTLTSMSGAGTGYDPFDPQVNGTSRFHQYTANISGDASGVINNLLIADGGASYTNGDNMLNKATSVQIIARAYKNNTGVYSYAEWSTPITFSDNVAPGDPDFGSTNISVTTNFGVASFDRQANATLDSSNYVDVDFPEDMNVTTVPSIGFYDGRSTGSTAPTAAANSGWQTARKYRFYIKLASGVNYTYLAAAREWYLKISVIGMKDYSGVTLVSSGGAPVPAAANGAYWTGGAAPTVGATTSSIQGNLNVGTGNGKPGLYVFP